MVEYTTDGMYWDWPVLTVNVARLDAEWSKDSHLHVGIDGTGDGNSKKYQAWKERIDGGAVVTRPVLRLKEASEIEPGDARFAVSDGRHRIAVLRDSGETEIEVVASPSDVPILRQLVG